MKKPSSLSLALLTVAALAPTSALAQDAGLHHAQSGALIAYAESEVKVLYAALSAREFDMELTQRMVSELKRSVADAKKSTDRSTDLLSDAQEKLRPQLEKIRADLVAAEKQIQKLQKDLDDQVKPFFESKEEPSSELEEKPKAAVAEPNWTQIKGDAAWLWSDLDSAKKLHGKLAGPLKMPKLGAPKVPKGKRE